MRTEIHVSHRGQPGSPEKSHERIELMRVGYVFYSGVTSSGEADYRTLLPEAERRSKSSRWGTRGIAFVPANSASVQSSRS
jgi:hypothetical protein